MNSYFAMYEFISGGAMCEVPPSLWLAKIAKVVITLNKSPIFRFTDEQFGTFFFQTVSFVNSFVKSDFFHLPTTNTPMHR